MKTKRDTQRLERRALLALCGVGLIGGILLGLTLLNLASASGTWIYNLSVLAAVIGTYDILIMLLLISRLPIIERAYGQDRLVVWHKRYTPWALWLIIAHVFLVVLDAAGGFSAMSNWFNALWNDVLTMEWVFAALIGLILFFVAGITSWNRARKHLKHETWWTIHLYMYLAVLFAFLHQVEIGGPFAQGFGKALWVACYGVVFGMIAWYRVAVPYLRSRRHKLVVEKVIRESDDVVSIVVRGSQLRKLKVAPGQFFNWRFDAPGLAYESHPYSVSGTPVNDRMRISVKNLGNASGALATIKPGTRAYIEGPYGASTDAHALGTNRTVLIAGGIGISPIISLARAIAGTQPVDLVYRVSNNAEVALRADLRALEETPQTRVHILPGSRAIYPMDAQMLGTLLGDVRGAAIYICGPNAFNETVQAAVTELGVPAQNVHVEHFDW
ncbi:putative ferric reductase [Arcanobacterium pluranimalium]|uniref:ferredoxin reductase family protein n=1 Tax=Arcanobacterium pluranimalium TaxID=108028 RepID=UPI00195C5B6E|nr:ferredoxin reductase family protein [Arcanobacterium pluranimalium]MBM7824295.1 putative ferric reductase [Arcanobacterium pluranimalium]